MQSNVVAGLETHARWRSDLDRQLGAIARFLADHELDGDADMARLRQLRERVATDRIVVAFVAEFSRGKSELINAIFFADVGRRILPATPGRTTMCPVELHHDGRQAPQLSLLPIETRTQGLSLSELRKRPEAWQQVPLDPSDAEALAQALQAVTRTQRVSVERAADLGLWNEEHPEDNPPRGDDGLVDVPAWRHAVINYPHPLLKRGLVVIDTPGLNAIGAEPELTLSLLPSAHATVFLLAADTGVTRSDLSVWREHLSGSSLERFVVLNKIDTLVDPLGSQEQLERQIASQCQETATTLGLPGSRVFPVSARDALAARVAGDAAQLRRSRLPELEQALAAELMPRQREMIGRHVDETADLLRSATLRRLSDRRRQCAEQLLELRGLRGKSGAKLRMLLQRVDADALEFEGCTRKLAAVRSVQLRMLESLLAVLSGDTLRAEVAELQQALGNRPLALGARQAFTALCSRLRSLVAKAAGQMDEMRQMLEASSSRLNTEFGFAFNVPAAPSLSRFVQEFNSIESSYTQYLTVTQAWRMALPGFREQFRRMLLSRLRIAFESAAAEVELWSKAVAGPMDEQLRERRAGFLRRREALQRVESASGELEMRIAELELQDRQLDAQTDQLDRLLLQTQALAQLPAAPVDAERERTAA